METIRENNVKFNPDEHNTATTNTENLKISTDVWITSCTTGLLQKDVSQVLVIETGACRILKILNTDLAQELINMLNQHIEYIKEAEIELLARQTKAAA